MDIHNEQPLVLEKAARWLASNAKENRIPLLSAIAAGLLAYLFAFTNKLVNLDEVQYLLGKGATLDSGRWGLDILSYIFPDYSMPWIYGILTLLLMAVAICMIIHIFSVKSKLLQALLAANIIVFPSLIGTFSYMFTTTAYATSFLLAVLSVSLIQKPGKYKLYALGCMVLPLSIYQSYVAITASMLVLVLIQQLLQEEHAAVVLKRGITYVIFLVVSLGIYFIATKLLLRFTSSDFNWYATNNVQFSLQNIPSGIQAAYTYFFRILREGYLGLIPTELSLRIHHLCIAALGILLLIWAAARKDRKIADLLLLLVLFAVLPLAINCMYLIASIDSIHTLVLYSFIAIYILAVILMEACLPLTNLSKYKRTCRRIAAEVVTIGLAVFIVVNTYIANASYLSLYLRYENAYAFYSSLTADIKMMPEFNEDTKLAVVGQYQSPDFYRDQFPFTQHYIGITGVQGFSPDSYSKACFLQYYIGFPITCASYEEIEEIQMMPEYEAMPVYPYYGSMQIIGDFLVVKLS